MRPSPERMRATTAAVVAIAAVLFAAVGVPSARADGDPASDILLVANAFLPQDANIPPAKQAQILALTKQAKAAGVPIKVAIVGSKFDLGAIQELFGRPQQYAQFLGAEIQFVYRGRLLVVMPSGMGVYNGKRSVSQEKSALRGITVRSGGAGLADAALLGTQQIAAVAGRKLTLPSGTASTRAAGGTHKSSNSATWIALGVGLALVALAFVVSIRLRPLRKAGSGRSKPRESG